MDETAKPAEFLGTSLDDLKHFPQDARAAAGFQIYRVQLGLEPADCKPFAAIGPGVQEIRIRDAEGAFRVIYMAKFAAAVFVLHCFQKKTRKTSASDISIAKQRYAELLRELQA